MPQFLAGSLCSVAAYVEPPAQLILIDCLWCGHSGQCDLAAAQQRIDALTSNAFPERSAGAASRGSSSTASAPDVSRNAGGALQPQVKVPSWLPLPVGHPTDPSGNYSPNGSIQLWIYEKISSVEHNAISRKSHAASNDEPGVTFSGWEASC